jgi:hypothetical protein
VYAAAGDQSICRRRPREPRGRPTIARDRSAADGTCIAAHDPMNRAVCSLSRLLMIVCVAAPVAASAAGRGRGASVPPRTRVGTFRGTTISKLSDGTEKATFELPMTMRVRLRTDRLGVRRAYVTLVPEAGSGAKTVTQSLIVRSDEQRGGSRRIEFEHPAAGSRSARYNLRQMNDGAHDKTVRAISMAGRGVIEVGASIGSKREKVTVVFADAKDGAPAGRLTGDWRFSGKRPAR